MLSKLWSIISAPRRVDIFEKEKQRWYAEINLDLGSHKLFLCGEARLPEGYMDLIRRLGYSSDGVRECLPHDFIRFDPRNTGFSILHPVLEKDILASIRAGAPRYDAWLSYQEVPVEPDGYWREMVQRGTHLGSCLMRDGCFIPVDTQAPGTIRRRVDLSLDISDLLRKEEQPARAYAGPVIPSIGPYGRWR